MNNLIYSFFKFKIDIKIDQLIKIQSVFRGYLARKQYNRLVCKNIIELLNNPIYKTILQECYFQILQVLKQYPPAKNEYKFIYGKLIEQIIINTLNTIKQCSCLDDVHKSGSEYKYDCKFSSLSFSIKASKNISNITIINKKSKATHYIGNMNFIICYLIEKKLCIFPCNIINKENISYKDASIDFKARIFKGLNDWSVNFPELTTEQQQFIDKLQEVNIYKYLLDNFVQKNTK